MPLLEGKTPAERNKMIAAIAFGALALFLVGRMFFASSETPPRRTSNSRNANARTTNPANGENGLAQIEADPTLQIQRPVVYNPVSYNVPDPGRNIFAFHVAPVRTTTLANPVETVPPTPTPTPPPPLTLSSISPASVMARTGDFALQVSGDKFTSEARVYVDGQELPTTFTSAQQLSAKVPAALIGAPGSRQIVVRTPDNQLYSDPAVLNVAAPPTPPFTYIGLLGSQRYNDKAILKNQSNDLVTVQRGDLVGGRFKVTSISPRSVEFTDAQLQIKHTLPYVESRAGGAGGSSGGPAPGFTPPPPPKTDDDDDDKDDPPN